MSLGGAWPLVPPVNPPLVLKGTAITKCHHVNHHLLFVTLLFGEEHTVSVSTLLKHIVTTS